VVTLDALATFAQALIYNVPRRAGPFDLVVIAIAILAPTLAALMLWNARGVRDASPDRR
jgi:phosphatidylglycerol lysyltransferase